MQKINCVFTGGGSGGHIFPAVAVARSLVKKSPELNPVFFGAKRGMEARIFPNLEFSYKLLSIGPLNAVARKTQIWSLLRLPFAVAFCICFLILKNCKFVIGFGGYASAPMIIAAKLIGRTYFLWEGNATPGMLTRKTMSGAACVFLASEDRKNRYKGTVSQVSGVPTRLQSLKKSRDYTEIESRKLKVLVFGGSQGALSINKTVYNMLTEHEDLLKDFEFYHQVGSGKLKPINVNPEKESAYTQVEFIDDMAERYRWADISICRSGASTIAELTQMALPSILVPLPTAADNHQYSNALELSEKGAAILVLNQDLNPSLLSEKLRSISNKDLLTSMSDAALAAALNAPEEVISESIIARI